MGSTDTRGRGLAEQGIGVGETSYPAGRNANAWLFCWWWLHHGAWGHGGILVPRPGIKPLPLRWELAVLTTGQPGKYQNAWHSALCYLILSLVKWALLLFLAAPHALSVFSSPTRD